MPDHHPHDDEYGGEMKTNEEDTTTTTRQQQTTTTILRSTRNRVQAKEQVRQIWHERRQERRHHHHGNSSASASSSLLSTRKATSSSTITTPKTTTNSPSFVIPSLCAVLRKTWNEQVVDRQQPQSQPRPKSTATTRQQQRRNSNSHHQQQQGQQSFFPSVLSILQAYALVQQVEGWNNESISQEEDEEDDEDDDATSTASAADDDAVQQAVLSVWPSDYDWNQAIWQTAQSRSRVFLLYDLTAIVRRLVLWKQFYCKNKRVKFLFHVQANPDSKLLQVLIKSKCIQLVTSSKADIARVRDIAASLSASSASSASSSSAVATARSTQQTAPSSYPPHVVDVCDSTLRRTGPPDGYIRELVYTANVRTMAVTHVEDIARIRNTLQRLQQRRQRRQQRQRRGPSSSQSSYSAMNNNDDDNNESAIALDFMLVLPNEQTITNNNDVQQAWPSFVQSSLEEIHHRQQQQQQQQQPTPSSVCAGLSFHVGPAQEWKTRQETVEQLVRYIHQYCSSDNDNDNNNNNHKEAPLLRIDITGLVQDPFPTEWTSWWDRMLQPLDDNNNNKKIMVGEITVDGTTPLVEPAGALCTRIIGVRQEDTTTKDHFEKQENDESAPNNNDEDRNNNNNIRRHYYIDDGCYGSLSHVQPSEKDKSNDNLSSSSSSSWNPLPLRPHKGNDDVPVYYYSSTIWGPTCDGLDRVCSNIPLPRLERDDWLVFPNRGCSLDQTTGFNGFDPPDTAFCVLEYFPNDSSRRQNVLKTSK